MSLQIESESLKPTVLPLVRNAEEEQRERAEALPTPHFLEALYPRTTAARSCVERGREGIRRVLHGEDEGRLVVIVGPCSIHSRSGALEYAERLSRVAVATETNLIIAMRTYFEKPRTRSGWKGLLNDPDLDGSCDLAKGLRVSREILLEINQLGLPCATEFLDPLAAPYLEDLVSWVAIGARTSESQTHRELASGLTMPVGFKNGTDGSLDGAHHAIFAAREPHTHLGISSVGIPAVLRTPGNRDGHLVLRGGGGQSNCGPEAVAKAASKMRDTELARPIIVDCSHANSRGQAAQQLVVARSVADQFTASQAAIAGIMLESNLEAGRQDWGKPDTIAPGTSLTDACIDWDDTERLIFDLAERVEKRFV